MCTRVRIIRISKIKKKNNYFSSYLEFLPLLPVLHHEGDVSMERVAVVDRQLIHQTAQPDSKQLCLLTTADKIEKLHARSNNYETGLFVSSETRQMVKLEYDRKYYMI